MPYKAVLVRKEWMVTGSIDLDGKEAGGQPRFPRCRTSSRLNAFLNKATARTEAGHRP